MQVDLLEDPKALVAALFAEAEEADRDAFVFKARWLRQAAFAVADAYSFRTGEAVAMLEASYLPLP